jgi:hypothetical protein
MGRPTLDRHGADCSAGSVQPIVDERPKVDSPKGYQKNRRGRLTASEPFAFCQRKAFSSYLILPAGLVFINGRYGLASNRLFGRKFRILSATFARQIALKIKLPFLQFDRFRR